MHGNWYKSQNLSSRCLPYPHQRLGEMKSLCTVASACAQWWPKSHVCSCHHPSAALEKWWQYICWLHFNSWRLTDVFLWLSPEMRGCWMVCPNVFNPLNPELNPICYLLALLAHHFLHVSRIRIKSLTIRLLMSYIYIWSAYSWCF